LQRQAPNGLDADCPVVERRNNPPRATVRKKSRGA
jgi:hypothetical protein